MQRASRRRVMGIIGGIVLALLVASCDDDDNLGYAPEDCHRVKPDTGYLLVKCTISTAHPHVPITLYRGSMELGTVVLRDTLDATETDYEMPVVGSSYTVVARYHVPPDTVLVIDAARLEVESHEYEDATCYYVKTQEIDVRLRD